MSNKKSSIEYYIVNLINILGDEICNKITIEQNNKIVILEKQAKAMHKEEKKQVLKDYFAWHKSKGFVSHKKEDIEEFINETFEGNNED